MNEEIKIIDLLNKIAKGEKLPKKIMYFGLIYEYCEKCKQYENFEGNMRTKLYEEISNLNDKVEIIEEDNKIKKIKELNNVGNSEDLGEFKDKQQLNNHILKDKINELIDEINALELIDEVNALKEDK